MTSADFRTWRRRNGLSRVALLDTLRALGWTSLTIHAVNSWGVRGTPEHVDALLGLWDKQRTPAIAVPESETAPNDAPVTIR